MKKNIVSLKLVALALIAVSGLFVSESYAAEAEQGTSTEQVKQSRKKNRTGFSLGAVGMFSNSQMTAKSEVGTSKNKLQTEASATGNSIGFGLLPELRLSNLMGIELGLFYDPRKITDKDGSLTMKAITATPMARFHVIPDYLSLGAGLFISQAVGDVEYSSSKGSDFTATYKNLGLKKQNWGAAVAAGAALPASEVVSLLMEARYLYGFSPIYKETDIFESQKTKIRSESKIDIRAFQLLLGAKFKL